MQRWGATVLAVAVVAGIGIGPSAIAHAEPGGSSSNSGSRDSSKPGDNKNKNKDKDKDRDRDNGGRGPSSESPSTAPTTPAAPTTESAPPSTTPATPNITDGSGDKAPVDTPDSPAPPASEPAEAPTVPETPPTPNEPPTNASTVQIGSVGGTPDLPGSAVLHETLPAGGEASRSPYHLGTDRVFDIAPGTTGPFAGGDPRAMPRTINPETNTGATAGWSGNLIVPNALGKTGGALPGPGGSRSETIRVPTGSGELRVPGKGGRFPEVGVERMVRLRVVKAVPIGTRPVVTALGDTQTLVRYQYQFEMQTQYVGTLGGNPTITPGPSDWAPVTAEDVAALAQAGVPLPALK